MNGLANVRTRDYIIKNIREQILSGAFPAGTRLAQEELAEALGVSRIPVREALQILEEQGLVERLPNRHMVVAEIGEQQLHQIFEIIGGLQFQYSGYILMGNSREEFQRALACWDGRDEMAFHRLIPVCLDNHYLGHQFNSMLDIYVEYACGLPGVEGEHTLEVLMDIRRSLIADKAVPMAQQMMQYYQILENKVMAERKRQECKA